MVLQALDRNNLCISAKKTIICPRSTTILGWIWTKDTLKTSPHRTQALSVAQPPPKVQGLRSFIGAYKVLSRVLQGYACFTSPLEQAIAGLKSHDKITWSNELQEHFKQAQDALSECKTITLPLPTDSLTIVTDASVKHNGIGATLYIQRDKKLLLAGYFNAKLKKHQVVWLPCEVKALCIGSATRHFSPYLIESLHYFTHPDRQQALRPSTRQALQGRLP